MKPKDNFNPIENSFPSGEESTDQNPPIEKVKNITPEAPKNVADPLPVEQNQSGQQKFFVNVPDPIKVNEVDDDEKEKMKRIIQIIIIVVLVIVLFFGIILMLRALPQTISNLSNWFKGSNSAKITATTTPIKVTATLTTTAQPKQATSTPTTTPITNVTKAKTAAYLSVGPISTYIINGETNLVFNIQNNGGSTSGIWSFSVNLPSNSTPVYRSPVQEPLAPGAGFVYTLKFTQDTYQYAPIKIDLFY